jgi:cell wall assembly regulator SMI1
MWACGRTTLTAVACAVAAWGAALAVDPVAPAAAATTVAIHFGDPHWVPLTGDWDGSGTTQIGAYDPSTATFYLGDHNGAAITTAHYGDPNWVPLAGDWNGSGRTQIGAYDPSTAIFYLGDQDGAAITTAHYGDPNWVPLAGDWDGSGATQIGA